MRELELCLIHSISNLVVGLCPHPPLKGYLIMKHTSRFDQFNDRERDLLRMALRRFYDDMIRAVDRGLADPSFTQVEVSVLLYEINEK